VVNGTVAWAHAHFTLKASGRDTVFNGNGLPVRARTGTFPVAAADDASKYVKPSKVGEQYLAGRLARKPYLRHRAGCVGTGAIGIATDGVPILPPLDRGGRDLVAREVRDSCAGRPDNAGLYSYRAGAPCLSRGESSHRPSRLIGYARDGFPIFGPRGAHGRLLRNSDLDACHGRTDIIRFHGHLQRMYHYNVTGEFPYLIGCFRGRAAGGWSAYPKEPLDLKATPGLFPAFAPSVTDYVVRCTGAAVRIDVHAGPGQVAVDGQKARRGRFSASVPLSSGQSFMVTSAAGKQRGTYRVRCLPPDFPKSTYQRFKAPSEEFDILTPQPYVAIYDTHGVPVWWYRAAGPLPQDGKLFAGNTVGWFSATNPFVGPPHHEIHRLDGSLAATISARPTSPGQTQPATDAHDIQQLPNGDFMVVYYKQREGRYDLRSCGGPENSVVVDAEIQRVRPGVSAPIWVWNSKDHIAQDESSRWCAQANDIGLPDGTQAYDLVHLNSLQLNGNSLLVSMRHTDAVYDIDYTTGKVVWKLGGTTTPESLAFVGDPEGTTSFGGQHYARQLPDGTITVHDNRTRRPGSPRGARYRIDTTTKTATLLEQVSDPVVTSSFCCGSAEKLADGAWLASWGGTPVVSELDADGTPRFRLTFSGTVQLTPALSSPIFSYRVSPVPRGRLSLSALHAGMDAMHPRH
jgi:hypothetical protein